MWRMEKQTLTHHMIKTFITDGNNTNSNIGQYCSISFLYYISQMWGHFYLVLLSHILRKGLIFPVLLLFTLVKIYLQKYETREYKVSFSQARQSFPCSVFTTCNTDKVCFTRLIHMGNKFWLLFSFSHLSEKQIQRLDWWPTPTLTELLCLLSCSYWVFYVLRDGSWLKVSANVNDRLTKHPGSHSS